MTTDEDSGIEENSGSSGSKIFLKLLVSFSLVVVVLFASVIGFVSYLMRNLVESEVLERLDSPSGEFASVLHTSDGGATTTTAMFVAILPSDEEDYEEDEYRVLTLYHTYDVSMTLADDRSLDIRLPSTIAESEYRLKKNGAFGVTVRYLEQDERLEGFELR